MSTGKKIVDLRVVDLRQELEKRGLEKAGNKGVLVERLSQALIKEGLNPDDYTMETMSASSTPSKKTQPGGAGTNQDSIGEESSTDSAIPNVKVKIEPPVIDLDDEDGDEQEMYSNENQAGGDTNSNNVETNNESKPENISTEITRDNEEKPPSQEGESMAQVQDEADQGQQEEKDNENNAEGEEACEDVDNPEEDYMDEDEQDYEEAEGDDAYVEGEEDGLEGEEVTPIAEVADVDTDVQEADQVNDSDKGETQELEEKQTQAVAAAKTEEKTIVEETPSKVVDDEMDQDALHLTIGEDEEDDKNYILAEEREKDKPVEGSSDQKEDEKNKKETQKPAKSDQGVAKVNKANTKSASAVANKTQKTKPANPVKPPAQNPKTASLKDKLKEVKSSQGNKKGEAAGEPVADKAKTEKPSQSLSNVGSQKPKTKNPKEKEPVKERKEQPRDSRIEGKTFTSRRIVVRPSRPIRGFDKPRPPFHGRPTRPMRRSMSPRNRRVDISHRQTLSFDQIREMRERERQREREREVHRRIRERERREREELVRQREIERRNAEELAMLERERQRLRIEREKVEREKEELIRMEKERQRAERERIEREKEEIRRAKIEERSQRSQKRSFEPERDRSREYGDRKKMAVEVPEPPRRPERPAYVEATHTSAVRTHGSASTERRTADTTRHERDRARRQVAPGYSPARETPRASRQHFPERAERDIPRDWHFNEDIREGQRREKQEVPKEKRVDERRVESRIARERGLPITSGISARGVPPSDYSSSSRNDLASQHHRSAASTSLKGRSGERYEISKNEASFSSSTMRDEPWVRRATYGFSSSSSVPTAQISNSLSSRDSWLPPERKSDWHTTERSVSLRPSVSDLPERWVGSASSLGSSSRNVVVANHLPQIVQNPLYAQQASITSSLGALQSQSYSSDRYTAYNKSTFRRY